MSQLKEYFSYRKFAEEKKRIIFLDKNYFLQEASINCLQEMGHSVYQLKVADDPKEMLESLLKACAAFKPDAIMGMNHFGFDAEGKISALLNELQIPVIFWYLDDFRFIIQEGKNLALPNVLVFTFEKEDVPELSRLGFEHVEYLSTASALSTDKNYKTDQYSFLRNSVSYIGSSFEPTKKQWFREGYDEKLIQLDLDEFFKMDRLSIVDFVLQKQSSLFASKNELYHYAGYVSAHATQLYRINTLKKLEQDTLHIFGDEKWKDLGLRAAIHPPVNNIDAAPSVFANSMINLNVSSCQLKTGINLRLYDVPASGGFLLTDWKESIAELFDIGSEIIVYKSAEELDDLIGFYKKHPAEKEKITANARTRIEKEHLLRHRMQTILEKAEAVFG